MNKKLTKALSIVCALFMAFTLVLPTKVSALIGMKISLADYIKNNSSATCATDHKSVTLSGSLDVKIPVAKVLENIEPQIPNIGYPWGDSNKTKTATLNYSLTFPQAAQINEAGIVHTSTSAIFPKRGSTKYYTISGKEVTFNIPLREVDFSGLKEVIKKELQNPDQHLVTIQIPFSVTANSLEEAKKLEQESIAGRGSLSVYAFWGEVMRLEPERLLIPLTKDLSSCFGNATPDSNNNLTIKPVPQEEVSKVLLGDLKVNGNTQHNAILDVQKDTKLVTQATLDISNVKKQMEAVKKAYQGLNPSEIKITNLTSNFRMAIQVPRAIELVPAREEIERFKLTGANNVFTIIEAGFGVTDSDSAFAKLDIVRPESLDTFEKLEKAINSMSNELTVEVDHFVFNDHVKENTPYKMVGTLVGEMSAMAEYHGTKVPFKFDWKAGQKPEGKDSTSTTDEISLTLQVKPNAQPPVKPQPLKFSEKGVELPADLKIGNDSENTKVIEAKKGTLLNVTSTLDITKVKEQMKAIEDKHQVLFNNVGLSKVQTSFQAELALPRGLDFVELSKESLELTGANGKFAITNFSSASNKLLVQMSLVGQDKMQSYQELHDALAAVKDELQLTVKKVAVTDKAVVDSYYTMDGKMTGTMSALATHKPTGQEIEFDFTWNAVQKAGLADVHEPNRGISLTIKCVDDKPTPPAKPEPLKFSQKDVELPADLKIGNDSENEKVFEAKKGDLLPITGTLDISKVKEQMKAIETQYKALFKDIALANVKTSFKAELTVPKGLHFTALTKDSFELTGVKGMFEVTDFKLENNKLMVEMSLVGQDTMRAYQELHNALMAVENEFGLTVKNVAFDEDALSNFHYTIEGKMTGEMSALATHTISGQEIEFDFGWKSVQKAGLADVYAPDRGITLTLKCVEGEITPPSPEKPEPETPKPELPKVEPKKPEMKKGSPKTNDPIVGYMGLFMAGLTALGFVGMKKRKDS